MKDRTSTSAAVPIMDAAAIQKALRRVAHEIIERNADLKSIVLAGIPSRGVEIARRVAEFIRAIGKIDPPSPGYGVASIETGIIDVAMHRDDVGTRAELPMVRESRLPLPLEGRTVIIVDDVLFTGRTVRAAMDAIIDYGRPARVRLAVLCDRGHRELPIRADYVGKNVPTATNENVRVRFEQTDGDADTVSLERT
jgi:pyrimidine operon attenuation protein/uracil phosphoribosyltransferase